MVVVGLHHVAAFVQRHPECRQELSELVRELEKVPFANPDKFRDRYPSCKVLDGRIVVFKIRGNRYRLSMRVAYNTQIATILAMETHADYDRRRLR
jgi:mRNA interferase HigB